MVGDSYLYFAQAPPPMLLLLLYLWDVQGQLMSISADIGMLTAIILFQVLIQLWMQGESNPNSTTNSFGSTIRKYPLQWQAQSPSAKDRHWKQQPTQRGNSGSGFEQACIKQQSSNHFHVSIIFVMQCAWTLKLAAGIPGSRLYSRADKKCYQVCNAML